MKITMLFVLLSTQCLWKPQEQMLWVDHNLFYFSLPFTFPHSFFRFPSLFSFSQSLWGFLFLWHAFWHLNVSAKRWKMQRRNWMLWIRTSWQNTAAHVGGHFIENINSHKQHLEANSFEADKTVLWIVELNI